MTNKPPKDTNYRAFCRRLGINPRKARLVARIAAEQGFSEPPKRLPKKTRDRPIDDMPHCMAIAKAWFQRWYEFEKRRVRDPWARPSGCQCCCRPGTTPDGNVRLFLHPETRAPIDKSTAVVFFGAGRQVETGLIRCPHCFPMSDNRKTWWIKKNCIPTFSDPVQFLETMSGKSVQEVANEAVS